MGEGLANRSNILMRQSLAVGLEKGFDAAQGLQKLAQTLNQTAYIINLEYIAYSFLRAFSCPMGKYLQA